MKIKIHFSIMVNVIIIIIIIVDVKIISTEYVVKIIKHIEIDVLWDVKELNFNIKVNVNKINKIKNHLIVKQWDVLININQFVLEIIRLI